MRIGGLILIILALVWFTGTKGRDKEGENPTRESGARYPERVNEGRERVLEDARTHHPQAGVLAAHDGTIQSDLEALMLMFSDLRSLTKTGNPSGNNREITAFLTGSNPQHLALLPPAHPRLSPAGELLDRYGSPYFFHNLSAEWIEIRSAGPDGKLHSADDVTVSNLPADSTLKL